MRLKSAQAELKEKEKSCKSSGQAYGKDKEAWDAIDKEIKRIQARYESMRAQPSRKLGVLRLCSTSCINT